MPTWMDYILGYFSEYFAIGLCCTLSIFILPLVFKRPRFAPGPKEHPFVGHTFQVPTGKVWQYFEKLSSKYGPIIRLSLLGDEILVLNHPGDAEELLSRRSRNYSSRKPLIYGGKYQSHGKRLLLLPYGPELKKQRAAFYQMLQPRAVGSYERMQGLESTQLLYDMLTRPWDSNINAKRYAASLVFTLSYGKRLADDNQDLNAVISVLENFIDDCHPGAHLVDNFPVLDQVLPDFLAPWRAAATKNHNEEMKLYNRLVLEVKERMDSGESNLECFAARLWEQQEKLDLDLTTLSYVAGSAFEAGTGNVASSLLWFLMAMILFPECMNKAHAELDAVLGANSDTLPTFEHLDKLPYCVALTKEVFRWMPAAPNAFPHYSDTEDEYKGYKIKKNTMVIPCIWSMHRNEEIFPEASTFNPERFIPSTVSSQGEIFIDGHFGFGFGRRICPGRYLASRSVWLGITRLLWAFDIRPGLDHAGNPIPVDPDFCTPGVTTEPYPFAVRVIPRSEPHATAIRDAWANAQG